MSQAHLEVAGLSKSFDGNRVLDAFSLAVAPGEFITLLGPSGCGKTTLLRLVGGLLRADAGQVRVGGRDITALPPHQRNIGMVFQSYALFPHLDVGGNIAFGLQARGLPRAEIARRVSEALALVQLEGYATRPVASLSGGQQQRVSLARAVVTQPELMLLDEPFSALDRKLRETMQIETRRILRRIGATAIFVTHDQEEALVLSDRVVVMNRGRAEQVADPETLYARPATPFVLGFVGQSTRLHGTVESAADGILTVRTAWGPVRAPGGLAQGSRALVAVRPEKVATAAGDNTVRARVSDLAYLGAKTLVICEASGEDSLMAEIAGAPPAGLQPGAEVTLGWAAGSTLVYPA